MEQASPLAVRLCHELVWPKPGLYMDTQKVKRNMVKKLLSNRFANSLAAATVVALAAAWFMHSPRPDQPKRTTDAFPTSDRSTGTGQTLGSVDWESQEASEKDLQLPQIPLVGDQGLPEPSNPTPS